MGIHAAIIVARMDLSATLAPGLTGRAELVVGEEHTAPRVLATPVGMRVRATAEIVKVEGRTVFLKVRAEDEKELIGDGLHERMVVNVEKFSLRVAKKSAR